MRFDTMCRLRLLAPLQEANLRLLDSLAPRDPRMILINLIAHKLGLGRQRSSSQSVRPARASRRFKLEVLALPQIQTRR